MYKTKAFCENCGHIPDIECDLGKPVEEVGCPVCKIKNLISLPRAYKDHKKLIDEELKLQEIIRVTDNSWAEK